jgi:hypothetical protein
MNHDLHSIAAAALIAVADETHVAGGVVGLWKVAAGHRIVSAFDFFAARQELARAANWGSGLSEPPVRLAEAAGGARKKGRRAPIARRPSSSEGYLTPQIFLYSSL